MKIYHKKKCIDIFKRLLKGNEIENISTTFISKNGEEIHVEGCANCRFDKGKPIFTRGIFRDISERENSEKRLEEEKTE